jgi:hypothetical protein
MSVTSALAVRIQDLADRIEGLHVSVNRFQVHDLIAKWDPASVREIGRYRPNCSFADLTVLRVSVLYTYPCV